ncbi:serine/threonine protein kinase [bacterium]|nr:serine/threonine protein kinase [bacterium]MBP9810629.1 serine/threonine protein kinase [bacterium]
MPIQPNTEKPTTEKIRSASASDPLLLLSAEPVILRYRAGFAGLAMLLALSPIWLCWSVFAAFTFAFEAWGKLSTGGAGAEIFMAPILFYLLLISLGALAVKVCADTKLIVSKEVLRLPWQFLFDSKFCISRPWSTLVEVDFVFKDRSGIADRSHPQRMFLRYSDGAGIGLALNGLSREDLKEFILSVQAYAAQAKFKPSLNSLDLNLSAIGPRQSIHSSFTQMWEDELESRFGSTIFVPLEPGQVIDYQSSDASRSLKIEGQLSFGGLSAVYLVSKPEEANLGQIKLYVLKEAVLPLGSDDTLKAKALEMFARESMLLSSLSHDRIAKVLDYFVSAGRNYILLEHIEGVDLRCFVSERGAQPAAVVVRWLLEAAKILQYLHSQNPPLIHRDVTPDNLVLARDGGLSLIDFGAANALLGTATGTLVGKQSYIAPEQFRGKAGLSSDIYSLGATAYFALTGLEPEPLTQLHVAPLVPIAASLDKLIADCTCQSVSERIKSIDELIERVQQL